MTQIDTAPGAVQATPLDPQGILRDLRPAVEVTQEAAALGKTLAAQIKRIYFVSCGAPNRVSLGMEYWLDHYHSPFEVKRYFPAEFMTLQPELDQHTLVILASKSGTTAETVEAAKFLRDFDAITLAVTATMEKPLAQFTTHVICIGDTEQAHTGIFVALQAVVAGLLADQPRFPYEAVMQSLPAVPGMLVEAAQLSDQRGKKDAERYRDDREFYHIAAGPVFATAYVFGVCMLMEMQWLHSVAFEAAEWFHGPFEIFDDKTPVLILLGEDPSRPLAERAVTFCQRYSERVMVYDSRDFPMTGIAPEVRGIFAPYALQAALNRFAEHLAEQHNQSLDLRRYMWITEY
ncbi:fructosamine deglycase FrlB [Deinococcus rubellus]|uniref:SIS domain-containing protein n=1 Tax=Deinococcus rubellus TaxID=1889240 RepID=UPI0031EA1291